MGRPKKNIDPEQVKNLAAIHCTMQEIAAVVGCSVDTLEKRFSDIIKEGKDQGKASLRRQMWKAVNNGNVTMMIWMSKQLLGMSDKQVLAHAATEDAQGETKIRPLTNQEAMNLLKTAVKKDPFYVDIGPAIAKHSGTTVGNPGAEEDL